MVNSGKKILEKLPNFGIWLLGKCLGLPLQSH